MVGDPVQLPATVISPRAVEHNYDCSLFKRLQGSGYPVHVLNMQYRMHPSISCFPSREFYQGQLLDGPVGGCGCMPWGWRERQWGGGAARGGGWEGARS